MNLLLGLYLYFLQIYILFEDLKNKFGIFTKLIYIPYIIFINSLWPKFNMVISYMVILGRYGICRQLATCISK